VRAHGERVCVCVRASSERMYVNLVCVCASGERMYVNLARACALGAHVPLASTTDRPTQQRRVSLLSECSL